VVVPKEHKRQISTQQKNIGLTGKKGAIMTKKIEAVVSHYQREIEELRADRDLAAAYLKLALQSLDDPNDRAAGLLALRSVAEAYGGLALIAQQAGISREALYRALSAKGNPTLRTILAVLKAVGMKLSVELDPESVVPA
jgi:probable addiction module antidote protein